MANKPGPSGVGGGMSMSMGGGMGAGLPPGAASGTTTQEYTVRVPRDSKKKFGLMKFASGVGVDFAKLGTTPAKIERENNFKEYKTANDLDVMPKFGAGSEFGRDQKEEARRKKYGIVLKKYNPDEQPWLLKVGGGKQAKKYRGVREGTITENTSYYIFTQCADGAFEAFPVDEWYNFTPVIRYKYLNSDEAEEEFLRRDKTLNYFNIMLKKRVKNEDKDTELDEEEKAAKSKASKSSKKNKDFMLTDMDDWADLSDDDDGEDEDEDGDGEKNKDDGEKDKKKKKKGGKGAARPKKKVKNAKQNSDDEAIEESDEGDFDDKEVDYMSDSSSSGASEAEKDKTYEEKGVADEGGLRNILNSDDEEEEEEVKEEEDIEEEEKKDEEKPPKEKRGTDSSSSSSDSDSDIDKDFPSALLMQKERMERKNRGEKGDGKGAGASSSADATDSKGVKRKADGDNPPSKKSKKDHSTPSSKSSNSDGISEETIRRYLQRKPMTTKDLLQKFRSKKLNMTIEQMSNMIAPLLKRLNPERTMINKKLYLSLKKPE
ncbi:hypothetical protein ACOMHN_043928 [Nucella lapillus]